MIARFLILVTMIVALVFPQAAAAQTATVDWADAGVPSLTPFASGTSVAGSDGTSATVTWTSQTVGGGSFNPAFGGAFVSYFSGQIGSSVSPLLMSFDNSSYDPRDRVIVTIVLSREVTGLRFALSDIDTGNFADAVEVGFDNDLTGGFTNAALTNAFWTAGPAVARTNDATVNGWRGIANASNTSTAADLQMNFGNQAVRRIQITYFSYTGSGNPGTQFAAISDLTFNSQAADLSLTKQLIGTVPPQGGDATWRLTVTNATSSNVTANGIVVRDTLPSQFVFDSAAGTGTFNPGNGEWSVGSLAPGQSVSIDITGAVNAPGGTTITNVAEIIASSAFDPDSTPNNGVTSEDDYATSSFTVRDFSTTPPVLSCPAGQSVFDWDAPSVTWTGGSLNNSYAFESYGQIGFSITGDADFDPRASFGGAVPALTNAVGGGLSPSELALAYNLNNANRNQQAVTTITLPRAFTGVQFTIFDIDSSSGFQDRVTAYGLLDGQRVNAILTGSAQNEVNGDTILGTGGAADNLGIANGIVTFLQPIDTIVFEYGNGPAAPANPTNQSIALHDLTVCVPIDPVINVSKISSIIADPVRGSVNPLAIPGATVEYLITVSNSGNGAADAGSLEVWDDGPVDAKMCLIARSGGPVIFADPGGNSGLTYDYGGTGSVPGDLALTTDDLEFSSDGGLTFTYVPTADAQGCDTNITDFRVRPDGAFAAGGTFTLRVRFIIE